MPELTWVRRVSAQPLGQEHYQQQVIAAVRQLLTAQGEEWTLRDLSLTTLRSDLPSARRMPSRLLAGGWASAPRALGSVLYGGRGLVHRFDVRLPPARREVVTILDAAPFRFSDEGHVPAAVLTSLRGAQGAICCSHFAAEEAREVFGVARTWVAAAGVEERFHTAKPLSRQEREALGLPEDYVLHVGGSSRRKGLDLLAAAWRGVQARHPDVALGLVGPHHQLRDALFEGVSGAHRLGRLQADVVPRLMAGALAVVVPSRYEGFGMPALEAMAAGAPVLAAAAASLPEVVGDAGLLVPAEDADALAGGLLRLLEDAQLRDDLIRRGRTRAAEATWTAAAEVHVRAYREATAGA